LSLRTAVYSPLADHPKEIDTMTHRGPWIRLPAALALCLAAGAASGTPRAAEGPEPAFDPVLFKALSYRNIGPYRGGRVTAVTGVAGDRDTFFMGSTGGGVWKTSDGGVTWRNVSDEAFTSASVGAIAVASSDTNVVYAGTGSACVRGNTSPGDGVYRSTDAGKTWKHVGLREAGQIGQIRIHPKDADLVYVAAVGHAFGPNKERGLFRSRDGGGTWEGGSRHESPQPEDSVRRHLAGGAKALDSHQRRRGEWSPQVHRRRRHMGGADGGSPGRAEREDRGGRLRRESGQGLGAGGGR
jgi:hypothetical protein